LARLLAFAVPGISTQRSRYPSPMTSLDSVPKVDANLLAIDALLVAAIDARQGVIQRACTKYFHARNLVDAFTALASMIARSKHAARTAVNV